MPRPVSVPPRLHRLPQWADQILIPAPSDLSLSEVANKSPLPTIIVTPCSPSSSHDFSLAFIPSPPKRSLRDRLRSSYGLNPAPSASSRVRTIVCAALFLFFICQVLAGKLVERYPRLDLGSGSASALSSSSTTVAAVSVSEGVDASSSGDYHHHHHHHHHHQQHQQTWLEWFRFWTMPEGEEGHREPEFVPFDHEAWLD